MLYFFNLSNLLTHFLLNGCIQVNFYVFFQELTALENFHAGGLGLYCKVRYLTYPCLFADIIWS
jgi:hypothetical protein